MKKEYYEEEMEIEYYEPEDEEIENIDLGYEEISEECELAYFPNNWKTTWQK